jgi:SNF2 family DNA or RNA helicase
MLELDSGTLVTAALALVRLTRLQQLSCGFLPDVENPNVPPQRFPRDGTNPRLQHLLELCEDLPPSIIWARFTYDVDEICRQLGPARCVRYDGEVSGKNRDLSLQKFSEGDVRFIVAKASSMGVGLTINRASAQVFYSNTFSLLDREQAENRCHRPGQHRAVTYYDLVAYKTIDDKILQSLKENAEIASKVTGDIYRSWLEES